MRLPPIPQWLYSSSALRLHLDAKSRIHLSAVIPGMQIFIPSAHEGLINQVVITDATVQGKTIYANKAFKRLTDYDPSDVIGKTPRILQGVSTDKKVIGRLAVALKSGKNFQDKTVTIGKKEPHLSCISECYLYESGKQLKRGLLFNGKDLSFKSEGFHAKIMALQLRFVYD